jgi:hypothetical protein
MEQLARIFGVLRPAMAAAPPIIHAPLAQSKSKRAELTQIKATQCLFEVEKFLIVWTVTDVDFGGLPLAYSLGHAMTVMRQVLTDLHGPFTQHPSEAFLRNAVLMLWHTGDKGLKLENFLPDKGVISSFARLTKAWYLMRRAYGFFCGAMLSTALDVLGNRLAEVNEQYPLVSITSMLFLAESRLGRLATVPRAEDIDDYLEITELELLAVVVKDNQERARTGRGTHGSGASLIEDGGSDSGNKGAKRNMEGRPVDSARGVKKARVQTSKAPILKGASPCWDWILQKGECCGKECGRTYKGAPTPLNHFFDGADKGFNEWLYRALVK